MKTMGRLLALLLLAGAPAFSEQDLAPPVQGSLAGVVTHAKTGAPLKKAQVSLIPLGLSHGPNRTTETDDQGRFVFRSLAPGRYRIGASRQGFITSNYGARKAGSAGTSVIVAEAQNVKDLAVPLMPQSVVTGTVLDEDGDPVANVMVRTMRYTYRNGTRQWFPTTGSNTNDVGEFRISGLEPGKYLLATYSRSPGNDVVRTTSTDFDPDAPERIYAPTYYPSTLSASVAIPLDVGAGDEIRGMDIRLLKSNVYRVRGQVVGYQDSRAVSVMLASRDNAAGTQYMGVTRGPEFDFEIRHVMPGEYIVTAQSRTGNQLWIASEPVMVSGANLDGVKLTLLETAEIHGVVKVVDASPVPDIKNMSVRLSAVGALATGAVSARVRDDMQFTLANVSPIRYNIFVSGFPTNCYVQSLRYGGVEIPAEGAELRAGGTLEITLSAQAAQLDAVATIADNRVGANAAFALVPKGSGPVITGTADDNGLISFKGLKPGDYLFFAWEDAEEGAPLDPEFRKPFESLARSITLAPSAHETISFSVIPAAQEPQ